MKQDPGCMQSCTGKADQQGLSSDSPVLLVLPYEQECLKGALEHNRSKKKEDKNSARRGRTCPQPSKQPRLGCSKAEKPFSGSDGPGRSLVTVDDPRARGGHLPLGRLGLPPMPSLPAQREGEEAAEPGENRGEMRESHQSSTRLGAPALPPGDMGGLLFLDQPVESM
ncbi:UNVERIFIED_CONTAM: hypothetical protein K2H54_051961 [Gekko kuhli]